jgi:hypothetical protein
MVKLQRYKADPKAMLSGMTAAENGEWVRYGDVERILNKIAQYAVQIERHILKAEDHLMASDEQIADDKEFLNNAP